jgi:pyruvate dehydrogenase E1 component alpha subunit
MYRKLQEIRQFEERVRELFANGKVPGFTHLYAGQEAVAVGVCAHLRDQDFITSTHRGHGHCIAKGADLNGMMAEIFGKATGVCKGKGGSMHIAVMSKGIMGVNPIVGGGIPHSCGLALSARLRETGQRTVCFMGDGASNQGTCHESMNLASIWKLPVTFVIENNRYAQSTPQEYHQPTKDIYIRGAAYNIPAAKTDGMDIFAVYDAMAAALEQDGPYVLECDTYRFFGHFEGDNMHYRSREETKRYREERDCIKIFRDRAIREDLMNEAEMNEIDRAVTEAIDQAVAFADESPWPEPEAALEDVYVKYP